MKKDLLVNIDSRYRNTDPKHILDKINYLILKNNILVNQDSNIVRITFENKTIKNGDKIVLKNVETRNDEVTQGIYFIRNFDYALINLKNHGFNLNYQKYYSPFKIEIKNIDYDEVSIGNIPTNFINNFHQVYLIENGRIENNLIPVSTLQEIGITQDELSKDYFAIKLNTTFIFRNSFLRLNRLVTISRTEIGGIPLSYLNANYPVTSNQRQGYHLITNSSPNFIEFESSIVAYKSETVFGENIILEKIIGEIPAYPEISNYTIQLKRTLTNVSEIELVSSEIPNTINVVTAYPVSLKNNKLYWQNLEDGTFIYSVEIPTGNYNRTTLLNTLSEKLNNVKRISTNTILNKFNIFNLSFDKYTQEFKIEVKREDVLSNAIYVSSASIDGITRTVLEIFHPNNNIEVGDIITIENATSIGRVPSASINTEHEIFSVNRLNESYQIILSDFNPLEVAEADLTNTGGGQEIKIISKGFARFLFDRKDTLGEVLGFRDVGKPNAITSFSSEISNFGSYANEENFNLNQVGKERNPVRFLNLTGDQRYLLLYLNDFDEVITNTGAPNCFAKIALNGDPGEYIFNSHISFPIKFDYPIPSLSQLQVRITYPNGDLVNFGNVNHSFTLKVSELIYDNNKTNLDSKTINIYREKDNKNFIL